MLVLQFRNRDMLGGDFLRMIRLRVHTLPDFVHFEGVRRRIAERDALPALYQFVIVKRKRRRQAVFVL